MFVKQLPVSPSELTNLLQSLQHYSGTAFLDSASSDHNNSNFSVFAWAPRFTLLADLKTTSIFENNQLIGTSSADPLSLVNQYLQTIPHVDSKLPFTGGAIGYWDYELGGRYESLPAPKNMDISMPNMHVGIYDQILLFKPNYTEVYFISHRENASETFTQLNDVSKQPNLFDKPFKLTSQWRSNMTRAEYETKFNKVQEYLLSGDCYQINLAQRFKASYLGDEWNAYLSLREKNAAPFSSFIRIDQGAILSVSPERFLQVCNNKIETKPIKGTRPRSKDKQRDIANANELAVAEKDRAENLMIVDLLRNDLSKVAVPGSVLVPQLFAIESFPAVHHLVSTVTASIRPPFTAIDLLRGAFPGGSITGAPKIRAMEIIHELEPDPRSVYCGAIGYIKPNGDMDTNITIRTLVCNQQHIYCWAGGGLVADSICDSEYQETLDKVNRILPILAAM